MEVTSKCPTSPMTGVTMPRSEGGGISIGLIAQICCVTIENPDRLWDGCRDVSQTKCNSPDSQERASKVLKNSTVQITRFNAFKPNFSIPDMLKP